MPTDDVGMFGLIPAWAGKTPFPAAFAALTMGSSPRGRGKHERERRRLLRLGLIPAWAGKTLIGLFGNELYRAHPRVGGENTF